MLKCCQQTPTLFHCRLCANRPYGPGRMAWGQPGLSVLLCELIRPDGRPDRGAPQAVAVMLISVNSVGVGRACRQVSAGMAR